MNRRDFTRTLLGSAGVTAFRNMPPLSIDASPAPVESSHVTIPDAALVAATLDQLHDDVFDRVGVKELAFGVRFDFLKQYFADQVVKLTSLIQTVPTSLPRLIVKMSVDPKKFLLNVDVAKSSLLLDGEITLDFRTPDDKQSYRMRIISFQQTRLVLEADPSNTGEFQFNPVSSTPIIKPTSTPPDSNLIKQNYKNDQNEYIQEELGIMLGGAKAIIEQFAHLIPFPRIRRAMKSFLMGDFVTPPQYLGEYIIVAGVPVLGLAECPFGGSVQLELNQALSPSDKPGGTQLKIERDNIAPQLNCNKELSGLPDMVLYYPKDITFVSWSRSRLGPAIGAQDSGGWLFTEWHYAIFALLDRINVALDSATNSINVTSAWTVQGSAGAGVRVPCASIDFVEADIRGTIGPIQIRIEPCFEGQVLFLQGSLIGGVPNAIDWKVRPLPFPLDKIAGDLLAMILTKTVLPNVAPVVDLFKIKLLDLTGTINFLRPSGLGKSVKQQSSLIGLNLARGI